MWDLSDWMALAPESKVGALHAGPSFAAVRDGHKPSTGKREGEV